MIIYKSIFKLFLLLMITFDGICIKKSNFYFCLFRKIKLCNHLLDRMAVIFSNINHFFLSYGEYNLGEG